MNRLSDEKREQIVRAMVEGNSVRSITRMTGVCQEAILKLLCDLGTACAEHHDHAVRNVAAKRIQADEIWSFVYSKAKQTTPEMKAAGCGDVWTWTAIDADSKLCISYLIGGRDTGWATDFAFDIRRRVVGRPQITTDAHKPYLAAIEMAFGEDVHYAMLHKIYGASGESDTRYSPGRIIGTDMKTIIGSPDYRHVSTSFAERQNLTMRMSMRRFTRLTNAFSKKLENHCHAVAIYFAYYNWCRVHQTLRVTPAMEAGLAGHVWSVRELLGLIEALPSSVAA